MMYKQIGQFPIEKSNLPQLLGNFKNRYTKLRDSESFTLSILDRDFQKINFSNENIKCTFTLFSREGFINKAYIIFNFKETNTDQKCNLYVDYNISLLFILLFVLNVIYIFIEAGILLSGKGSYYDMILPISILFLLIIWGVYSCKQDKEKIKNYIINNLIIDQSQI